MILAYEIKREIRRLELRRDLLKVQIDLVHPESRFRTRLYLSLYHVQLELNKFKRELASLAA